MAGLDYDQIAELLGMDRERVQARLAGALVQISETLRAAEG
jgi:DNA-directed RNA polymerase specialized sigma24 family protein